MIYIHIPFCRQICNYCDFYHSASLTLLEPVVAAAIDEMRERRGYLSAPPRTIYFGGGTPSVLSPEIVASFISEVRALWGVNSFSEVTFEVNPDDITPDYIDGLLSAGVDRLSMGVQSFNDGHLRLMNRRHTAQQAIDAVRIAQNGGFANITIDLIYAMPFLTDEQWQRNLDIATSLGVQHISAYHLTIEPKTIFGKKKLEPVVDEISEKHFAMLRETLIGAGFEHYEVSNFAKPTRRAIHNSGYWDAVPYLGLGPSAHSFNGTQRQWNTASNKRYLEKQPPEIELLSKTDIFNERIMTRLRTADGLKNPDPQTVVKAIRFLESGQMRLQNNTLMINPQNFLVSDYIISELFV